MSQIWLIPLLPLVGSLLNGFLGKKLGKSFVTIVGPLAIGLAFLQSINLFLQMLDSEGHLLHEVLYTWMSSGNLNVQVAFQVDQLSGLFLLVITGVGFLIHVYSIGYMISEDSYYRYFSYLNLFIFFMLILVLGDSLLLLFVGWEGVGLCSYLLIGYYFKKDSAADASKKAFLFNRVGDFGFISACLILFMGLGTLNFSEINQRIVELTPFAITMVTLFFFLGATGKSAQIPLFVWLPDAMEGPTPVSALIHAATMVTSGLYMIARMSHIFVLAPFTMQVIAVVGAVTALLAATIAITQKDIKRVLAYSTVSQLGYMFLAMGVGAFGAGIFHVMTHAFFKALLFLCSGAVIHALHHEQDMMKMGGLWKKLPWTWMTMLLGTIAIAGIPPFSGFFSKDEILWKTWASGHYFLWFIGMLTACMTAFYMFRLIFLTFHGSSRMDAYTESHVHEVPWNMRLPLVVLAVLSVFGGFLGIPHVFHMPNILEHYFDGFYAVAPVSMHGSTAEELALMGGSVAVALLSAFFAWSLYGRESLDVVENIKQRMKLAYQLSYRKWYVDEVYDWLIIQPGKWFSEVVFWKYIDVGVIDRSVLLTGQVARRVGGALRFTQNGVVQNYAIAFAVGSVLILWFLVF